MLPGEDVTGWLKIDLHRKFLKINPQAAYDDGPVGGETEMISGKEALARLRAGNERFVSDVRTHTLSSQERRAELAQIPRLSEAWRKKFRPPS